MDVYLHGGTCALWRFILLHLVLSAREGIRQMFFFRTKNRVHARICVLLTTHLMNGYCLINDWTMSVQYRWWRFYYYYCYWPVESSSTIYYYVCTTCQSYTIIYCIISIYFILCQTHRMYLLQNDLIVNSLSSYAMCVQIYVHKYYNYYFQTLLTPLNFVFYESVYACMQICLICLVRFNLYLKTTLF